MRKTKGVFIAMFLVLNLISATLFFGCTKDDMDSVSKCYKVRLGARYCYPPSRSVLVFFDKPNLYTTTEHDQDGKPRYTAALSNFPMSLHQIDTVLYIKFHYDEVKDQEFKQYPCAAIFSGTKYIMLDEISTKSCDLVSKPE